MKRILLVRHAQCEMNLTTEGFIGGRSNSSPLTVLGRRQAAALGRRLRAELPELGPVFVSTAVRAQETATLLLEAYYGDAGVGGAAAAPAPFTSTAALLELCQGQWEGKPRAECYTPDMLAAIDAAPWEFAAPGGESQRAVEERVAAYVRGTVLPALRAGGPPALVVSHGLAIKCFLRYVLGCDASMTWKIGAANTGVTEVGARGAGEAAAGWHVLRVNDAGHLAAMA